MVKFMFRYKLMHSEIKQDDKKTTPQLLKEQEELIKEIATPGSRNTFGVASSEIDLFLTQSEGNPNQWAEKYKFKFESANVNDVLTNELPKIFFVGQSSIKQGAWVMLMVEQLKAGIFDCSITNRKEARERMNVFFDAFKKVFQDEEKSLEKCVDVDAIKSDSKFFDFGEDSVAETKLDKEHDRALAKIQHQFRRIMDISFTQVLFGKDLKAAINTFFEHLQKCVDEIVPKDKKDDSERALLVAKINDTKRALLVANQRIDTMASKVGSNALADLLIATLRALQRFKPDQQTLPILMYIALKLLPTCMAKQSSEDGFFHLVSYLRGIKQATKLRKGRLGRLYSLWHNISEKTGKLSDTIRDVLIDKYGEKGADGLLAYQHVPPVIPTYQVGEIIAMLVATDVDPTHAHVTVHRRLGRQ